MLLNTNHIYETIMRMVKSVTQKKGSTSETSNRVADYAIQGFLYQFNKTLLSIIEASDEAEITVEGLIEDIDVHEPIVTIAIQCKYHEGKSKFTLNLLYKPILQMMNHFRKHSSDPVEYRIYCYCPDKLGAPSMNLTSENIESVLKSSNRNLLTLIDQVKGAVDISVFIGRVSIEFGLQLNELIASVHLKLGDCGFSSDEVPNLIYPNALHSIATISIDHDVKRRRIKKIEFLEKLKIIRKSIISRWTLSLRTKDSSLKAKRSELKSNLSKNARRRTFIISKSTLSDFDDQIVTFISDFIGKFHTKTAHLETPMFCLDCDDATFSAIRLRIYKSGIAYNDGLIGSDFVRAHFLRDPIVKRSSDRIDREFSIRLLRYATDPEALNTPKCDDFFVIGSLAYEQPSLMDVNFECLATENLLQAKYILGVSNVYE
jgi:hypothetical protein